MPTKGFCSNIFTQEEWKWVSIEDLEEVSDLARCTRQCAQNAVKSAKFLSSQQKASQFIAENVIRK
jgi:hypothetical protein